MSHELMQRDPSLTNSVNHFRFHISWFFLGKNLNGSTPSHGWHIIQLEKKQRRNIIKTQKGQKQKI
jgi:hypothetical protein